MPKFSKDSAYVSEDGQSIFSHGDKPSVTVQGVTYYRTEGGVCATCNYVIVKKNGVFVHTDPTAPTDHEGVL